MASDEYEFNECDREKKTTTLQNFTVKLQTLYNFNLYDIRFSLCPFQPPCDTGYAMAATDAALLLLNATERVIVSPPSAPSLCLSPRRSVFCSLFFWQELKLTEKLIRRCLENYHPSSYQPPSSPLPPPEKLLYTENTNQTQMKLRRPIHFPRSAKIHTEKTLILLWLNRNRKTVNIYCFRSSLTKQYRWWHLQHGKCKLFDQKLFACCGGVVRRHHLSPHRASWREFLTFQF